MDTATSWQPPTIESRPECRGTHHLWSPLPEACLETIDTDRPHQTDTPHVVPAGYTQIESAIAAAGIGGVLDAPRGKKGAQLVFFDDNYKFGLVSHVDLQLVFAHAAYDTAEHHFAPPGPLEVRVKLNVVDEKGWIPALTLVPTTFVPMDRAHALRGGVVVFWGWELPAQFELEMNAGVLASAKPKPPLALVLASALTRPVIGPVKAFIDVAATGFDVALGTGLLMPLGRDVQVDAGTYIGLSGAEYVATPFIGLSLRR
jgi:hypothetical protein